MTLALTKPGPLMAEHTTLGLGGRAVAAVTAGAVEDFTDLPDVLAQLGARPAVLGCGSNILADEGEIALVAVRPELKHEPEIIREDSQGALVMVQAGVRLPRLLAWAAQKGLGGLSGLTGIPGSVGGAVAMNAGSFGCEISACLQRVRIYSPESGFCWLEPDGWRSAYRSFKPYGIADFFVVLEVEMYLQRLDGGTIRREMAEVYRRKKNTQPVLARSAGCVFKNPADGVAAGLLLERAGMKNFKLGGMSFSRIHANFMVNDGNGNSRQALELIEIGRERVKSQSGYELELEVKLWPWN